ncbi:MAG: NUDIX hydrolase [Longimicrobiales bacterium]|nr:NUDIX hydrolase [Longimicrobiales bacterium]
MTRNGRGGPRIERSAGGVVLRRIDGVLHVLLIRDPYRNWGLPKGHVEPGEDAIGAALREVEEETGLTRLVAGPEILTIDWVFKLRGRRIHKYCCFFLMSSPSGRPVPERSEGITACRWVALPGALDQISYENARQVLAAAVEMVDGADPPPLPL